MAISDYTDLIDAAAKKYGVDPALLTAQLEQESGGNANAIGPATTSGRAQGIAQVETRYHPEVNTKDAGAGIDFMASQLAANLKKYGDVPTALMAYYGGPNQKQWGPKTRAYPQQVLARMPKGTTPGVQLASAQGSEDFPADMAPLGGGTVAVPQDDFPTDMAPIAAPVGQQPSAASPQLRSMPHVPIMEEIPEYLGSKAVEGLGKVAGVPGSLYSWYTGKDNPFTAQHIENALGYAGLVNQAGTEANAPPALKVIGGGVEGAAETAPIIAASLATGGGADALLPTLASGFGAGAGGELAHESMPNSNVAPIVGSTLGAMGAGGAVNALARAGNYVAGATTPELAAFRTLGMTPKSPAYTATADSKLLAPTDEIKTATENELGDKLEGTVRTLGNARTYEEAGQDLQDGATRWLNNTMGQRLDQIWKPINDVVQPDAGMNLAHFRQAVDQLAGGGGELKQIIAKFKSQLPAELKERLATLDSAKVVTGSNYDTTWQNASLLRRAIGDARGIPQVSEGLNDKDLTRLYAALSDDMRDGLVEQVKTGQITGVPPGELVGQYEKALADSEQVYGIANGTMKKIVNSSKPAQNTLKPGAVAKALATKGVLDSKDLSVIRQEMPAAADELAAAHLRESAFADPEAVSAPIDPGFAKRWATLPQSTRDAMVPDQAMQQKIDAAARLAQRVGAVGSKAKKGSSLAEIGISSYAGGNLLENMAEAAARYFGGGQSTGDILGPGSLAYIAGATAPVIARAGRNALANSAVAARIAGIPGARFAVRPWQLGTGIGTLNALYPSGAETPKGQGQ